MWALQGKTWPRNTRIPWSTTSKRLFHHQILSREFCQSPWVAAQFLSLLNWRIHRAKWLCHRPIDWPIGFERLHVTGPFSRMHSGLFLPLTILLLNIFRVRKEISKKCSCLSGLFRLLASPWLICLSSKNKAKKTFKFQAKTVKFKAKQPNFKQK